MSEGWDVKLCDFGLARSVTEPKKKQRMTLCGTDDYMVYNFLQFYLFIITFYLFYVNYNYLICC